MAQIRDARRCGNSTRQVDEMVQELFNTGKVTVTDHAKTESNQAYRNTLYVLRRRLHFEHDLVVGDQLIYNANKRELKFK